MLQLQEIGRASCRERLYLLSAKRRFINGKILYFKTSTFLENINPDLLLVEQLT